MVEPQVRWLLNALDLRDPMSMSVWAFPAGPSSGGITGTTLFVDAGYHIMGV